MAAYTQAHVKLNPKKTLLNKYLDDLAMEKTKWNGDNYVSGTVWYFLSQ